MAGFNFGGVANAKSTSSSKRLRAYDIHEVKFEEAKIEDLEIKNGDRAGETAKVIKTRFVGENGYFEETTWFPVSDRDAERQPNSWGGENPSNFDRAKMFVIHVLGTINPEGFKKLQVACANDKIKTFDQFAAAYVKLANEVKGFETKLKLVGRTSQGNVQPALPFFCAIGKDGEPYLKDNFLGENVAFSAAENQKKIAFENAKPTSMAADPDLDGVASASSISDDGLSDTDLQSMLNGIDDTGL